MEHQILLDSFEKVQEFVKITNKKDFDVDLLSGKYLVNAKSIMGVFSLDLTHPLTVVYEKEDPRFIKEIEKFFA